MHSLLIFSYIFLRCINLGDGLAYSEKYHVYTSICIGFSAQTQQFVGFALQSQMDPCREATSILCMGRGTTNFWIELTLLLITT